MTRPNSVEGPTCVYAASPMNEVAVEWLTMMALELGQVVNLPATRDMSMLDAAVLFVELAEEQQRRRGVRNQHPPDVPPQDLQS